MKVELAVLGLPVPNKPHGFFGRKALMNQSVTSRRPRRVTSGRSARSKYTFTPLQNTGH